jgi:hypothetical protein
MQVEQQSDSSSELETEVNQTTDESNKPGETEDSLLAVVQSVSAQADEQSTDAGDTDSPTEEQGQDTVTEQADGEQPEDFSKLPFNKHPRFRELVKEKNSYKTQVAEYEADAKQYREIQGFMQANGLTAEEVAQSLETLAKMKTGDPAKAYELMQERLEAMAVAAGKKLPAELEEKVEQGYIDRETAQELHQRQAEAERKAEMASTQLERQSQQDQQAQVHAMASAVAAWEQSTKATDPDFDLKAELVKDRVRAHVAQHGMPKTTDAALKMSKDAYDAVTQTLLRVRGDKTPMRTAVGGKTNGSAAPEPKSLLDVVRRASAGA